MSNQRRQPTHVISVRFSDDELQRMKELSERAGTPVSTLIRQAALQDDDCMVQNQAFVRVGVSTGAAQTSTTAHLSGSTFVSEGYAVPSAASASYRVHV